MHDLDNSNWGSAPATRDDFRTLNGERFAAIDDIRRFPPFLINVVSASDLWMFLSSRGGLTAGRGSGHSNHSGIILNRSTSDQPTGQTTLLPSSLMVMPGRVPAQLEVVWTQLPPVSLLLAA